MQNKLIRILFGVSLVICLSFGFFANPTLAQASSKKTVETSLETSPDAPKGHNDWYTSVTMVELDSNSSGTTYFQWNQTSGKWKKYSEPLRAWRGENTLYYYSVNRSGVKEAVKSKVIKVDYLKPVITSIEKTSEDASAKLVMSSDTEDVQYRIYKRISGKYRLIDTISTDSYIDKDVKVGQTYVYSVVAIDDAGLKSKQMQAVVEIKAPKVIVVAPVKTEVKPQIAQGTSVVTSVSTATVSKVDNLDGKGASVTSSNEAVKDDNPEAAVTTEPKKLVRNWNRLYTALLILVIASAAAVGGYYGYEWWAKHSTPEDKPKEKKSNSRW